MPAREGQRLGNYRLHHLLGTGSFAEVYLGEHLYLKTSAAIKVLSKALNEKDERIFLSEAQTVAQLAHPNIVRVHEFAIERSTPFLAMDYAPGGTLRHRYPAGVCLSLEQVVLYVKQIAAALQYAHNKGVIHRDIKAENILQGSQHIILSDFGISVQAPKPDSASSQEWAGTFAYMAPEQFQGKAVFASDQYALAVLTYEWLCGVRPFEGSALMLAYQHREGAPTPLRAQDPSLPEAVETVILRAMSKNPQQRYVSVVNFARALERASHTANYTLQTNAKTLSLKLSRPSRSIFLTHAAFDDITHLSADLSILDVSVQDDTSSESQEEKTRQAIRAVQVVCVVLTPHTSSSAIVQEHLRIANLYKRKILCLWAHGDELRLILPIGAEQATILDARGPRYKQAIEETISFLEREQRGGDTVEKPLPVLDGEPRNPYKGLRAFTLQDRADFFGRASVVQDLLTRLEKMAQSAAELALPTPRFQAVVGPSGSGKSSVVMAGLLPRLQDNALPGSNQWIYLDPMVPGKQPLEALAQILATRFPEKGLQAVRDVLKREGGLGLHQLGLALVDQSAARVVVTIDQFEELFSMGIPEPERKQFIQLLVTAASEPQGPVLILLTLRADFYDRPFTYPELGRLIQRQQCAVLPLSTEDLREVIERPAALPDVNVTFDEDLVDDLLFDLRGQVGALPLLEFALDQLFHHRRDRRLTRYAYQEIGGVRGALSKHAEATYDALPSDEHRRLACILFMRLIQPATQQREPIRRRAEISEFVLENAQQTQLLREVTDAFVAARLITINQFTVNSTLEVSHEALIREWPRLTTWLQETRADMQLQQTISKDVSAWEQRGKPKDHLYHGSQLKEALAWQKRSTASSNEVAFLQASRTRHTRTRINILLAITMLFALLIPTGIFFLQPYLPLTVTTLQDDGPGSLRQVIANARPSATIIIDANLKGAIILNKTLVISKDLTLRGPGMDQLALRGTKDQGSLLSVFPHSTVTISQLTFSDPTHAPGSPILNDGTLTLDNCQIIGNTNMVPTSRTGSSANGGGIINTGGTLTLQNSIVAHNTVTSNDAYGGGISSANGTLVIENSQIVDNRVIATGDTQLVTGSKVIGGGGGIYSFNDKVTLIHSTIARNQIIGKQDTVLQGGGIESFGGSLSLTNSTVNDNSIEGTSSLGESDGGGIASFGSAMTIRGTSISGNTIASKNVATGGGIESQTSEITIDSSTISNNRVAANTSVLGGGIISFDTNDASAHKKSGLTLTDTSVSHNSISITSPSRFNALGGGIMTQGPLTLNRTTISLNTINNSKGEGLGGGIYATDTSANGGIVNGALNLTNCTIADNKVLGDAQTNGGGIAINMQKPQNNSINFCTIYGNSAIQGGGIMTNTAPPISRFSLKNSIVAGNSAIKGPDISGIFATGGYNLIQRPISSIVNDPLQKHNTDLTGDQFPNLGIATQLSTNGGPTPTLALQAMSPMVNMIPASACDQATDQRGVKRPQQDTCDIGAYEYSW